MYSFTSTKGLEALSEKIRIAISKLASSIENVEMEAERIKTACRELDAYHLSQAPEDPKPEVVYIEGAEETTVRTTYYHKIWLISGQDAVYARANDVLLALDEVKASLNEQFKAVASMVANIGEAIEGDEGAALDILLGNIAYNKYDAKGNHFIDKDKILKQYWKDGKLEFADEYNGQPLGNGVKIILKNGVPMGFTTAAAYNQYIQAKKAGTSSTTSGPFKATPNVVTNENIKNKQGETFSSNNASRSQEHERVVSGRHKTGSASSNKSIETDANAQKKVENVSKGINTAAGERHHASNNSSRGNAYQKTTTAPSSSKINPTPADPKNYKTVPEYAKANNDSISVKLDKNGGWAGDNGQGVYRKIGEFKKSTFARDIKLADGRKLESDTYFTHNGTMHWVFKDKKTGDSYVSQPGINNYSKIVKTGEYDHNM